MKKVIILTALMALANSPSAFTHPGHTTCAKGHVSHNNCNVRTGKTIIVKVKTVSQPRHAVKVVKIKTVNRPRHTVKIVKIKTVNRPHHTTKVIKLIKKRPTPYVRTKHRHHYKKSVKRIIPTGNRNIVHKSGSICRN